MYFLPNIGIPAMSGRICHAISCPVGPLDQSDTHAALELPGRPLQFPREDGAADRDVDRSTAAPEIHSFTCRMLSQYSRAEEAPVPGSQ
jgi:hypothetical protein